MLLLIKKTFSKIRKNEKKNSKISSFLLLANNQSKYSYLIAHDFLTTKTEKNKMETLKKNNNNRVNIVLLTFNYLIIKQDEAKKKKQKQKQTKKLSVT